MRKRTEAEVYIPDPSAKPYSLGRVKVRLLAGDIYGYDVLTKRLHELATADQPELEPAMHSADVSEMARALALFVIWDDPAITWESPLDPDEVMQLRGAPLLDAARALRAEILAPRTQRLGIQFRTHATITRVVRALAGLGEPPEAVEGQHTGES